MHYILTSKNYEKFELIPEDHRQPIIAFEGAKLAAPALPGDRVTIKKDTEGNQTGLRVADRAKYQLLFGFLDVTSKTIHGFTSRGAPIVIFYPFDRRFPPSRVGCNKPRTENLLVSIRFEHWASSENLPRGSIIDYIGPAGNIKTELFALGLSRNPWPSKYEVLPDMSVVRPIDPSEPRREVYAIQHTTVHIDPEGCKDIDDAISIIKCRDEPNTWEVTIHIADVADKIDPGSEYDIFARQNAQTVYDTDGHVIRPMLPVHISEDLCSLKPTTWKRTVALRFLWNPLAGAIAQKKFIETYTLITHSATYDNLMTQIPPEPYEVLKSLCMYLGADPDDTHTWVEVLMIAYNAEAAVTMPTGTGILRAQPEGKLTNTEVLKAYPELKYLYMEQAKYDLDPAKTHWSLGNIPYCHATSPIRRYADIINQRAIKAHIRGKTPEMPPTRELIYHLNQREKWIKQTTRAMLFVEALYKTKQTTLEAIIVENNGTKLRLYVPTWKKMVTYRTVEPVNEGLAGTHLVEFFFDATQKSWQDKLILRLVPMAVGP